ncbi:hypothetical protein A9G34_09950 [Gilliamella sp. Choc4-2]|jgi:uncharacterized membrane protein|uniref:DUF4282 domain-containing protein n=1 Tax=unclassified Gilliamella TaxID=2685620 RepID=UPI00080EC0C0|nr:DUF4282 domain-containing protein [Gilliamella apicola]OCG30549.1 hypothetical protein A9G33_07600 [Gilliamella apicola]OCG43040.1 hypothetical protein A9G34_09950 [Gilliamella apicola]OCG54016.1 hypothetical protein A9G36_08965 [Gilliamella apicola]OCG63156.1 hypothetical protein A9G48_06085 [Gilliamella apicola]
MNNFKPLDLLFFRRLIMPSVLTFLYWLLLAFIVIMNIINMCYVSFLGGLFGLIGGVIATRLIFELMCVFFSINRNLEKLVDLQSNNSNSPTNIEDKNS